MASPIPGGIDLQSALDMFVDGTKQLALSQSLNQANEEVQKIKMSGAKEADQRVQLGQLAQGLVSKFAVSGATGTQIDAIRSSFTPKQYASTDAAILDANLTGNQTVMQAALDTERQSATRQLTTMKAQAGIQEASQSRLFAQQDTRDAARFDAQERIAGMKNDNAKPSSDEFKVAGFAKRIAQSTEVLDKLETLGKDKFDPASLESGVASYFPNKLRSKEIQQYDAAKRDIIAAILRRESGAAISAEEYRQANLQYFPQVGDDPTVAAQKKALRETVLSSYATEGARALNKMGGLKLPESIQTGASAGISKYLK